MSLEFEKLLYMLEVLRTLASQKCAYQTNLQMNSERKKESEQKGDSTSFSRTLDIFLSMWNSNAIQVIFHFLF